MAATFPKIAQPNYLDDMFKLHPDLPFRRRQMEEYFEKHFDLLRNRFLPRNQCDLHGFLFSDDHRVALFMNLLVLCYNKVVDDADMTTEMEKRCCREALMRHCGERFSAVKTCSGCPFPVPEEEWPHLLQYARLLYVLNRYIFTVANCGGGIAHTVCDMLGTAGRRHTTGSKPSPYMQYREIVKEELCGTVRVGRPTKRKRVEVVEEAPSDSDAVTIIDNNDGAEIPSFTLHALVLASKREMEAAVPQKSARSMKEIACQTEPEAEGCFVSAEDYKRLQQLKAMFYGAN